MRESTTWQGIYNEGKQEGKAEGKTEGTLTTLHKTLLRLGTLKWKKPGPKIRTRIEAITDEAILATLIDRVLTFDSWNELLDSEKTD